MALRGVQLTIDSVPASLAAVGVPDSARQLDIQASPDNNDNVYIGDAEVASDNAWGVLLPGKSWGTKSDSENVKAFLGTDGVYVTGTEGEYVHIIWVD